MKRGIVSILLVAIIALIPCLPTLAQGNSTGAINITMTPVETLVAIELSQSEWARGNVTENTTYLTEPPVEWCYINNTGNVPVDIGINGTNAECVDNPSYHWKLSDNGNNTFHSTTGGIYDEYALWYKVSGGNYTLITLHKKPMETATGENITLGLSGKKQFGLRLLTPDYFQSGETFKPYGKEVKAHITISAVKA